MYAYRHLVTLTHLKVRVASSPLVFEAIEKAGVEKHTHTHTKDAQPQC